jgi:hypothetical protein
MALNKSIAMFTKSNMRDLDDQLISGLKMGVDEPTFEDLAARFRALTKERKHTPSEKLMSEGRDEAR